MFSNKARRLEFTFFSRYFFILLISVLLIVTKVYCENTPRFGVTFKPNLLILPGLAIWFIMESIVILKNKTYKNSYLIKREVVSTFFVAYLLIWLGVNLFPIDVPHILGDNLPYNNINKNIYLIPFSSVYQAIKFLGLKKYLYNLTMCSSTILIKRLLLSPLFISLWLTIFSCTLWSKFRNLKNCLLLALIASFALQIFQIVEIYFGMTTRLLDTGYVVLFTLGGTIGYIIFKALYKLKNT